MGTIVRSVANWVNTQDEKIKKSKIATTISWAVIVGSLVFSGILGMDSMRIADEIERSDAAREAGIQLSARASGSPKYLTPSHGIGTQYKSCTFVKDRKAYRLTYVDGHPDLGKAPSSVRPDTYDDFLYEISEKGIFGNNYHGLIPPYKTFLIGSKRSVDLSMSCLTDRPYTRVGVVSPAD